MIDNIISSQEEYDLELAKFQKELKSFSHSALLHPYKAGTRFNEMLIHAESIGLFSKEQIIAMQQKLLNKINNQSLREQIKNKLLNYFKGMRK